MASYSSLVPFGAGPPRESAYQIRVRGLSPDVLNPTLACGCSQRVCGKFAQRKKEALGPVGGWHPVLPARNEEEAGEVSEVSRAGRGNEKRI